jgi:hypothetical protein
VVRAVAEDRDGQDPAVQMWGSAEGEVAWLERVLRLASVPRPTGRVVTVHFDVWARPEDLDR